MHLSCSGTVALYCWRLVKFWRAKHCLINNSSQVMTWKGLNRVNIKVSWYVWGVWYYNYYHYSYAFLKYSLKFYDKFFDAFKWCDAHLLFIWSVSIMMYESQYSTFCTAHNNNVHLYKYGALLESEASRHFSRHYVRTLNGSTGEVTSVDASRSR